jgi:hypothetical protein
LEWDFYLTKGHILETSNLINFLFLIENLILYSWNILDFVIVSTAYIPYVIGSESGVNLSGLRSLRVLRPLRTISSIKALKILLMAFFASLP